MCSNERMTTTTDVRSRSAFMYLECNPFRLRRFCISNSGESSTRSPTSFLFGYAFPRQFDEICSCAGIHALRINERWNELRQIELFPSSRIALRECEHFKFRPQTLRVSVVEQKCFDVRLKSMLCSDDHNSIRQHRLRLL